MIQLSHNEVIKLYKLASVGKLVGGLVHNLNGPLQNLGLEIEIALYSLKNEPNRKDDAVKSIVARLGRMEEEHEKINSLIKTTSAKTGGYADDGLSLNMIEYVRQEIFFLHTNLYFKHNVETEIIAEDDQISVENFSQDSLTALGWFMQAFVEEVESRKLIGLIIKFINHGSSLSIQFQTNGGTLSEKFMTQIQMAMTASPSLSPEKRDMGIFITTAIFLANGITMEFGNDTANSNITLNFPIAAEGN